MKKNEELLEEYLNGEIFDEKTLKELYDNASFMKLLIFKTRDVEHYNLCSNRLKTNLDFVLFLTNIFDNNLNLLFSMINAYVYSGSETDKKFPELLYKIDKYIKKRESEIEYTYYMQYVCKIIWFFDIKQGYINSVLEIMDDDFQREYSLGFPVVKDYYEDSEITQTFFAEHYLDKILYKYDFEEYIHKRYPTLEKLNQVNNIIVLSEYVKFFDLALFDFVVARPELLKEREIRLLQVKDNYDNFILNDTSMKVEKFNNKVDEYLDENNLDLGVKKNIIMLEEIKRLDLDKEFFNRKIELPKDLSDDSVLNIDEEKLRLFMRTELINLFKTNNRKLELNLIKDDDE